MSKNFTGTSAELAGSVILNGKVLSKPVLSILFTYGLLGELAGKEIPAGGKGKHIHRMNLISGPVMLEFDDAPSQSATVVSSADDAPAEESTDVMEEVVEQSADDAPLELAA